LAITPVPKEMAICPSCAGLTRRPSALQWNPPMLYVTSKILGFFAMPSNDMLAAGFVGLLLMRTKRTARAGWRLVAAALVLVLAFGLLPLGRLLMLPLEDRFPPWDASRGAPDGIVVLGGGDRAGSR
jgi:hypothetical protein